MASHDEKNEIFKRFVRDFIVFFEAIEREETVDEHERDENSSDGEAA